MREKKKIYGGRREGNWNKCNKSHCSISKHLEHTAQAFSPFFSGTKDLKYKNVVYIHFIWIYSKRQWMAVATKFVLIFTIMLWSLYCVINRHIYTYMYMWCICVNSRKILLVDILNILHVKKYIKRSHKLEPQVCGVLMNSISSVTKCTICQLVPESKHSIRC